MDQLRVTHSDRVFDVAPYRGVALPGEIAGEENQTGARQPRTVSPTAKPYVARLCWNSKGWTEPTGDAPGMESKGSYVKEKGLGHEEWLFDPAAVLDGWQYGFLQPVNKSYRKYVGKTIDVLLWTIGRGRTWYYVGRLPACEVLTREEADAVLKRFVASGRFARMEAQASAVGANPVGLWADPLNMANVRFRADAAEIHDPLVAAAPDHAIRGLKRYTLVRSGDRWRRILEEWPATGRKPALPTPPTYPDEAHLPTAGQEGGLTTKTVNVYERDSTLRDACLRAYPPGCSVCGMTFEDRYGPEFKGMSCHVHHLTMISTFGVPRDVHPVNDMCPVCPNCHAAIHRKRDLPYRPEEIREFLRQRNGTAR